LWPRLRPAAPALALSAAVLGLLYHREIAAAVRVWNSSTAYGHCWLIVPIALFLAYERRGAAAAAAIAPRAAAAWLALPCVAVWLAADLLGIMEGRQLALVGFLEVLLLAAFGRQLWRALAASFLYLIFLVPFGAFITPALQQFTSLFIARGLDLLGIANHASGNTIEIPQGVFYVAEACAGLRFLIASIAFGVLYALTMFVSPWRRVAFVTAASVVPVFANGLRALGIVVLGHELGSAQAAATDHLLYGWIFFSLVIAALAALGMPFREDAPPPPPPVAAPPPGTAMRVLLGTWPVLALAAVGPTLAAALQTHANTPPAEAVFLAPPGCIQTASRADDAWDASNATQDFTCGTARLTARLLLLPRRANPSHVIMAAQSQAAQLLPGADLDAGMLTLQGATPRRWHLQNDQRGARAAVDLVFVDGAPALGGLRDRLRLAADMFAFPPVAPAVVAVAVTQSAGDPVVALRAFLGGQRDLTGRVVAAASRYFQASY
jgi:exosortase A